MEERHVNPEDGIQFATDLRRIREARGLSLQSLHESTRIETGVLRSFERNALFDHPVFNRVYLRSFVKTYAEFVGIEADEALAALEQAMSGMYRGQIGRDFFGEVQLPDRDESSAGADAAQGTIEPRPAGNGDSQSVQEASASGSLSHSDGRGPNEESSVGSPESSGTDPEHVALRPQGTAVTISSTPATDIQLPVPGSAPPTGMVVRPSFVRRIFAIAVTLAVIVVAILLVRSLLTGTESGTEAESSAAAARPGALVSTGGDDAVGQSEGVAPSARDTTESGAGEDPRIAGLDVLPDTVVVVLRAMSGPVRDIRIRVDEDLRRPYWIEADSVLSLRMADRMIVEDHAGAVSIAVPSINYEAEPLIAGYPFVLSRTKLDQFLASASRYRAGTEQ